MLLSIIPIPAQYCRVHFSLPPFSVTAHFSGSEKSVEPVLTTALSHPCMYSPDSLIHFGIISCHSKANLYTHTDGRPQSTWNHWCLCYVASAHWGWCCLCFLFLEVGAWYWPLQTLTTEIPTGKITLYPQFLPHSDTADLEGLTEILWNGLLGFACPWF